MWGSAAGAINSWKIVIVINLIKWKLYFRIFCSAANNNLYKFDKELFGLIIFSNQIFIFSYDFREPHHSMQLAFARLCSHGQRKLIYFLFNFMRFYAAADARQSIWGDWYSNKILFIVNWKNSRSMDMKFMFWWSMCSTEFDVYALSEDVSYFLQFIWKILLNFEMHIICHVQSIRSKTLEQNH